jgi:hypothetical protein
MESMLFFGLTEKQIEEHTAFSAATSVVQKLTWFVEDIKGKGKGYFFEQVIKPIVTHGITITDLKKLDALAPVFEDQPMEVFAEATNAFFIQAATVFVINAIKEYAAGRTQHAWVLVLEAERYLGMAMGSSPASKITKAVKSDQARNSANKKNAENRKIKDFALKHYHDNISTFSSMSDAAGKIAEKIVLAKFKTVLGWLSEFHKENPSIPIPTPRTQRQTT